MNNSGMELNAVLHAPGVPEKNDPPVKKGDVFKNSQDGSHRVVERVSQGEDGPIIYSSQDGSYDRRILGRPLKNFLVDVGVRDMESIDPIQNREPVFYAAYERQMTILEKAFAREFFACEKALDTHEDSLKGRGKAVFIALGMIGLNRQKMNEIADEWERTDDRLVRGGRRRLALLAEIRSFSQERFEGDLLTWKNEALEELTGEYGSDEPDELLVERGYFRDVLHGKGDRLLKKCRQVKSGKLKISDEVTSLPVFEREVKRLKDSIVGYESGDVDKESATIEIKAVLDALAEMDRVAFHRSADDEKENGGNVERKKSPRRMKKDESEDLAKKKQEGRSRRKTNKRDMLAPDGTALPVSPIISENGVQSEESPKVTTIGENVSDQPMKKPTESMPVAPSPEKGQEVLTAFKAAVEKEKQAFLYAIQKANTFKALKSIGFVVAEQRYFLEGTGDNITPALIDFVEKIKGERQGEARILLKDTNQKLGIAWAERAKKLDEKKGADKKNVQESPEEIIVGGGYVLKNDPSREYTVIEISGDGEIVYKPLAGGSINRSTREKFLQYLRAKDTRPVSVASESVSSQEKERGRQVEIELSQEMELWMQDIQKIKTREVFDELTKRAARNGRYTKAPGFVVGRFFTELLKKQSITSDQEKRRLKSLAYKLQEQIEPVYLAKQSEMYPPKTAISRKTESVAGVPVPASAVEAVKITPENLAKSSERSYDELFDSADETGDAAILSGSITKGIRAMSAAAKEGGVDFAVYHKEHPQDISDALLREMQVFFNHIGKNLGWTDPQIEIFARGLVQENIEKFLNKKV